MYIRGYESLGVGVRRGLDLFTCGRRARSCDVNQALGRATALNLRATKEGQVPSLSSLGPSRNSDSMESSHANPPL